MLRKLKSWYSINGLQVQVPIHLCSMVTKCPIVNTMNYNYFGVTFANSGNRFGDYYELKYGKALRAIYASRTLACDAIGPNIPITVLCKIFDTQIQPIIDYGSEVCYNRKSNYRLESLHLTYLKRALGVNLQISNLAIYGETGRYPLKVRQETLVISYWLKLMTLPANNPLKLVYSDLYRLNIEGHTNWCTHVEELMKSIGLGEVWDEQKSPPSVNNLRLLMTQSKYKLQHNYIREWFREIGNVDRHPILRTYAVFKTKVINFIENLQLKLTCMYTQNLFYMSFILLDHRHILLILMFQTLPVLAIRAPSATRHSYLVILRCFNHSSLSCGILCCFVWLMGQFWPPVSIKLLLLLLLVKALRVLVQLRNGRRVTDWCPTSAAFSVTKTDVIQENTLLNNRAPIQIIIWCCRKCHAHGLHGFCLTRCDLNIVVTMRATTYVMINGKCHMEIDQFHKSQNAPVPYPTMLHSEQKCANFCSKWSIAVNGSRSTQEKKIYGTKHVVILDSTELKKTKLRYRKSRAIKQNDLVYIKEK